MGKEAVFPRDLETPKGVTASVLNEYVNSSLGNLRENSPAYYDLVTSNLNTLILASPGPISRECRMNFGGATYFFFWGGTVVNAQLLAKVGNFFEQLVHESLHMTLFMACNEFGPLCENPDSETFTSAFRVDRRPMHGVIHAYFVAQNLSNCFQSLSKSSRNFEAVSKKNANSAQILRGEILRNARLTPIGKCILNHPLITDSNFCRLNEQG
jgi:HEXXH motif-containing protein